MPVSSVPEWRVWHVQGVPAGQVSARVRSADLDRHIDFSLWRAASASFFSCGLARAGGVGSIHFAYHFFCGAGVHAAVLVVKPPLFVMSYGGPVV